MLASRTGRKLLEFVPVIYNFVATCPTFFKIVKDGLAWMEVAGIFYVVNLIVILEAAVPFASFFPFLLHLKQQFKAYI